MIKILFTLMLCITLSGCWGLAVGTFGTYESSSAAVKITHKDESRWVSKQTDIMKKPRFSKGELYFKWGEPDMISEHGKCEVLTYYDGYTWAGVVAAVTFIPIPMGIPTGKKEVRFYFIDDRFVRYVGERWAILTMFGVACNSLECTYNFGRLKEGSFPSGREEGPLKVHVDWCD